MNRRSFLKWFGAVVATAAVAPAALPKIAEALGPATGGVVGAPEWTLVGESGREFLAYDLLTPPTFIWPALTPFRNHMPRMYAKMMLHEDRTIMFGKEEAERLRARDEAFLPGDYCLDVESGQAWINTGIKKIQKVNDIALDVAQEVLQ